MIVLDTNVVSEAMKPDPHPAVRAWLNDQAAETLYLSSVTLAEMLFGIGDSPGRQALRRCWHWPLTVSWGCSEIGGFHSTPMQHGVMPSWPW
ncbi:MAG: PIN domain-containing protein [Leptospirales bacterium]